MNVQPGLGLRWKVGGEMAGWHGSSVVECQTLSPVLEYTRVEPQLFTYYKGIWLCMCYSLSHMDI